MEYHCRSRWAPDHSPVWGRKGKQTKVYYKTCPQCKWWKAHAFKGTPLSDLAEVTECHLPQKCTLSCCVEPVNGSLIHPGNAYTEVVKND